MGGWNFRLPTWGITFFEGFGLDAFGVYVSHAWGKKLAF